MDLESGKQLIVSLKKYQYVLVVILVGVLLMMIPRNTGETQSEIPRAEIYEPDLEKELSDILSKIAGVGKAEVLLTEASGSQTIYQTDSGQSQSSGDTVIIKNGNREETGLVKQVLSPRYQGAVIVCQGADNDSVKLSVVAAVKSVTGLSSNCITVLKMK